MIPAQNLIQQPDELAAVPGFRMFSEKSLAPDLPPLRIMNYAFGLTLGGTATETIGLQTYDIRPYTVVFTFPGQIVSYTHTSPDLSFRYCVFDDAFMNSPHLDRRLIDGFGFFRADGRPVFHLSPQTGRAVHGLLEKIQAECAGRRPDHELLVRVYLLELFILINREYPPASPGLPETMSRGEAITRQFKELVDEHFLRKKRVQDYADLLCITPRHLTDTVTNCTGRPPSHWILTMEMLEARYLLRYSGRTVADIAGHLGYPDPAYFSKVFKKAAGCTPGQYRRA
jgi:AraC-like DNA-binding protein